jgi:hypothetical protein
MIFGSADQFNAVPALQENGYITKKYLKGIEDAIRQRTPISGSGITIKTSDGGYNISATGGGSGIAGANLLTLTVCSNGTPATIQVYGI